jgi:monoamine oxidase
MARQSTVSIVGAGLAGLAAARELERQGCHVVVFEARARVGGRVLTLRDGRMHGEAGGEFIDEEQDEIRKLARELGLREARVLRSGFSHYRRGKEKRRHIRSAASGWQQTSRALEPLVRAYKLSGEQWDGPIAHSIATHTVFDWLNRIRASIDVRATADLMRGFFVADPQQLSLLPYVEQFANGKDPASRKVYRLVGGNDRLTQTIALRLHNPVHISHIVRRITQTKQGVHVTVEDHRGQLNEVQGDYAIVTAPAPIAAEIHFVPALPDTQQSALARLQYGRATKTLLQFDRACWRRGKRPRAIATDLDIGAVWDGNEEQTGPHGMLVLLAAASASSAMKSVLSSGDIKPLLSCLKFFGIGRARLLASRAVCWEDDVWARGAYAFFDRSFPPEHRRLFGLPWKRVFFAGEHTSVAWQGYMNGADRKRVAGGSGNIG